MNPEARTYAQDILEHADLIQNLLADKSYEDYTNDWVVRSAVERQFSIIGEAVNGLSRHAPTAAASITAYPRIIAFRNILMHGYSQVDNEIVWDIAQTYLPTLINEVNNILEQT